MAKKKQDEISHGSLKRLLKTADEHGACVCTHTDKKFASKTMPFANGARIFHMGKKTPPVLMLFCQIKLEVTTDLGHL